MYKLICYTKVNNVVVPIPYKVPNTNKPHLYKTYSQASRVAVSLTDKPHPSCVQPSHIITVLIDKV
jgi:hypothetical protein